VTDRRAFIVTSAGVLLAGMRDNARAQPTAAMWRIGFLTVNAATDPAAARMNEAFTRGLRDRAHVEGRNLVIDRRHAEGWDESYPALAAELVRLKADVIVATTGPGTAAAKAATASIPMAMAGILMSYGPDLREAYRGAAIHVDKLLKGAKPADLPVLQAAKFELVVDLNTAKALGIAIPQSLLLRADEVIQ